MSLSHGYEIFCMPAKMEIPEAFEKLVETYQGYAFSWPDVSWEMKEDAQTRGTKKHLSGYGTPACIRLPVQIHHLDATASSSTCALTGQSP